MNYQKQKMAVYIASEYIAYTSEKEVVDFIFDNMQEDIITKLGINDKEKLVVAITYSDDDNSNESNTESTVRELTYIIANYISTFSDEDFIAFAIEHYDKDFSFEDKVDSLFTT